MSLGIIVLVVASRVGRGEIKGWQRRNEAKETDQCVECEWFMKDMIHWDGLAKGSWKTAHTVMDEGRKMENSARRGWFGWAGGCTRILSYQDRGESVRGKRRPCRKTKRRSNNWWSENSGARAAIEKKLQPFRFHSALGLSNLCPDEEANQRRINQETKEKRAKCKCYE